MLRIALPAFLLIAASLAPVLAQTDSRGITTAMGDPVSCTADDRARVRMVAPTAHRPDLATPVAPRPDGAARLCPPARDLSDYLVVDSLAASLFIEADKEYVVGFDLETESLVETSAPYALTEDAWEAIALSPRWLREALEWKFHLLTEASQDRMAGCILGLTDSRLIDEVAFQVAYLTHALTNYDTFDEELMAINAGLTYQIDPELQYVEIVDYDLGDGEFYSTTRYRVAGDGDTTWVEIPRETYYWYIVMPRISDEKPEMGSSVYYMFWREYLYYYNDPGYPLLRDIIAPVTVLWDGLQHDWGGGRPFTADMLAVDAVGNWCSETVPYAASGDRPIQPNIIAHGHDGNCGELQDLLCAAARTCLIPCLCTMDILEDHVWCEMVFEGQRPYQIDLGRGPTHINNPGIAYDADLGGGKHDSCIWDWRNDGYTWDAIATYSQTCSLTVRVSDSGGSPVDNATVIIASENYYPPYNLGMGRWGQTGQDGAITFVLGNHQNYYVRVISLLGNYPLAGYAQVVTESEAGAHYEWSWSAPAAMPSLAMTPGTPGTDAPFVLEVAYTLPYDQKFGRDQYATPWNYYTDPIPDGQLTFFIVDEPNLQNYLAEEPFTAYGIAHGSSEGHVFFDVPELRDYYVVLSGAEHLGLSTRAEMTVRLWSSGAAAPEPRIGGLRLAASPNPSGGPVMLRYAVPQAAPAVLRILDPAGREVRSWAAGVSAAGAHSLAWDGRDQRGRPLPAGTYFVRLEGVGKVAARRVTLLH